MCNFPNLFFSLKTVQENKNKTKQKRGRGCNFARSLEFKAEAHANCTIRQSNPRRVGGGRDGGVG